MYYTDFRSESPEYEEKKQDCFHKEKKKDCFHKEKKKACCYKEEKQDYCYEEEEEQTHDHEFLGSTRFAEECDDRHNHRFAGVSSEAIPYQGSHIHKIKARTDFFGHFHEICVVTGPAISVGDGKHVHLATAITTLEDGHVHELIFATLIEAPALD